MLTLLTFQVFINEQCVIIISENEYEHKLDHVRNGQTYFLVKTKDGNAKDPDKMFVKNKIKWSECAGNDKLQVTKNFYNCNFVIV